MVGIGTGLPGGGSDAVLYTLCDMLCPVVKVAFVQIDLSPAAVWMVVAPVLLLTLHIKRRERQFTTIRREL